MPGNSHSCITDTKICALSTAVFHKRMKKGVWKEFCGNITVVQDYAQAQFSHVKLRAAKGRKEMQTSRFPSCRELAVTWWLRLWLTQESLLTPVACIFHLTIGAACSLNLYSHRDRSRSCGKAWEEKKYLDKNFSDTNTKLSESQFAVLAAEKTLLCKMCEKCLKLVLKKSSVKVLCYLEGGKKKKWAVERAKQVLSKAWSPRGSAVLAWHTVVECLQVGRIGASSFSLQWGPPGQRARTASQ